MLYKHFVNLPSAAKCFPKLGEHVNFRVFFGPTKIIHCSNKDSGDWTLNLCRNQDCCSPKRKVRLEQLRGGSQNGGPGQVTVEKRGGRYSNRSVCFTDVLVFKIQKIPTTFSPHRNPDCSSPWMNSLQSTFFVNTLPLILLGFYSSVVVHRVEWSRSLHHFKRITEYWDWTRQKMCCTSKTLI